MHAWPPLAGRPHKRGSRLFLNWVFTSRERPKIASAPIWAASDADPRCAFFKGRDHGLTCSRKDDRRPRRSSRITRRAGCRFHHRYARQHDPAAPHERCAGLLARDLRAESLHLGPGGDANGRPAAARAARPGSFPVDGARWRPLLRDGRRCAAEPRGRASRRRRRQRRNRRAGRCHPRGGASRRLMDEGRMLTGCRECWRGGIMKRTQLYWQSILIVTFAAVGTLFAAQTGDALKIPGEFKHWYLVHSTLITKDDNKFGVIPGVHLIYVNATGLDRLKRGGSTPYPDGTMFTDDVREFSATDDGSYL